jgi:hypothetical protein
MDKIYWSIALRSTSSNNSGLSYYNIDEDSITLTDGYLEFIDPKTEKRVWISLAAPWYATEQEGKI